MADLERVNGNLISWGSAVFKLNGERYTGVTKISYGDKRTRVKAYGMQRAQAPQGRSRGKYEVDPVSVTMFVNSAKALREALAAASPDGVSYGDVEFSGVLSYAEPNNDLIHQVEFERLVWTENKSDHSEGADSMTEDIVFDAMRIIRDGKVLHGTE